MHMIDRHAYSNRLRRVEPAQKGGLAALAIGLCLLLDRPAAGLLTVAWMLALATLWARVPPLAFGRALLAEGLFLLSSVAGVALSVGLGRGGPAAWQLGPLWLGSSPAALGLAARLLTRALGCAAALNFLILTTPLVDLIDLLRRLRVPEVLIDLMTVLYRTIFVLLESLQRMSTAQDARLGYSSPRGSLHSAATLASRLFLETYERSRRMQLALDSRGGDGPLRVLPIDYARAPRACWLGAAMAASLLLAGLSL
jgi:cobalt/nickel transport system permease protein